MKSSLLMAALLMTQSVLAGVPGECLPDGTYIGEGVATTDQGTQTRHTVKYEIKDNSLTGTHTCEMGTETFSFEFRPKQNGFFSVFSQGKEIGQGYCGKVQCHYQVSGNERSFEQTLTLWQEKLYTVGSVSKSSGVTRIEESLDPQ